MIPDHTAPAAHDAPQPILLKELPPTIPPMDEPPHAQRPGPLAPTKTEEEQLRPWRTRSAVGSRRRLLFLTIAQALGLSFSLWTLAIIGLFFLAVLASL